MDKIEIDYELNEIKIKGVYLQALFNIFIFEFH